MEERETEKGVRERGRDDVSIRRKKKENGGKKKYEAYPPFLLLFIHWNSSDRDRELELRSVIEHLNNIILFRMVDLFRLYFSDVSNCNFRRECSEYISFSSRDKFQLFG